MWSFAWADGADVVAAWPLAIDGAVEFYLEADQRRHAEEVAVHVAPLSDSPRQSADCDDWKAGASPSAQQDLVRAPILCAGPQLFE
jgi:hypothetical protein